MVRAGIRVPHAVSGARQVATVAADSTQPQRNSEGGAARAIRGAVAAVVAVSPPILAAVRQAV